MPLLQQTKIRVLPDADDDRPLLDARSQQFERFAYRVGGRRHRFRPPCELIGIVRLIAVVSSGHVRARLDGDVVSPGELQDVPGIPRPPAFVLRNRGDAGDSNAWPFQQHGYRAQIVGVATDVRIDVNLHHEAIVAAPLASTSTRLLSLSRA